MGLEIPKILTSFEVPTGGWTLKIYISDVAQYDTPVTAIVPAGTYYVAWDTQASDFIWQINETMTAAVRAVGGSFLFTSFYLHLDSDHKVSMTLTAASDLKVAWTEEDGDEIGKILGFDVSADDTDTTVGTSRTVTADYQHSHGWYGTAEGQLRNKLIENISQVEALQTVSLGGNVTTQRVGRTFRNVMDLSFIPRANTYSRDTAYKTTAVDPYAQNVPLECWWIEAQQGTRFRVYRNDQLDTTKAIEAVAEDFTNNETFQDNSKTWTVNQWTGYLFQISFQITSTPNARYYISSNTADTLTLANDWNVTNQPNASDDLGYIIASSTYETYVVDLKKMKEFAPKEIPNIDMFDISIPLLKYVS